MKAGTTPKRHLEARMLLAVQQSILRPEWSRRQKVVPSSLQILRGVAEKQAPRISPDRLPMSLVCHTPDVAFVVMLIQLILHRIDVARWAACRCRASGMLMPHAMRCLIYSPPRNPVAGSQRRMSFGASMQSAIAGR